MRKRPEVSGCFCCKAEMESAALYQGDEYLPAGVLAAEEYVTANRGLAERTERRLATSHLLSEA